MEKPSRDDSSRSVYQPDEESGRPTEIQRTDETEDNRPELPPVPQTPSILGWVQNRRRRQPNIVRHFDSGIRIPQAARGRLEEPDTEEGGEVSDEEVIDLPPEYSAS
ncbi:hypothetical protein VKT23_008284 [Stygiomarasmius scandens]|uniref:Uncharacterized protein n=1 Tax=Marasmiellus scandens TaxID=2682957 RepID=A0ABR1JNZ5_9AGAR